ncbi:hypothetical protein FK220_008980 [Flavobacteriaceae bacterium TP-CH-4]|uniref:Cardiolipin synthase N-terminal domain-containing protein n=1 Tax=Pelagihabitans pacificus TaxID=2696054 RepID=A0A967AXM0_9FLAO|nr:hypothetical protein [Pelagihabitans pacificus]NHF59472.1 hypothetical protein [Pelagihabitans pacificus]
MLHNKFWQAFFALSPILIFIIAIIGYMVFVFSLVGNIEQLENSGNVPASYILGSIGTFFVVILLAIFIALSSLIFYIMHAVQNPNLKENNLLLVWILLFIFVGGIGKLMYWIIEIVGKRNQGISTDQIRT